MRRRKVWWAEGSYTLEAAFVVPIILGILFAMLYFLYYEHDKAILQGNLQESILGVASGEQDLPDSREWKKQLQKHLWRGTVTEGTIKKKTLSVQGSGAVEMRLRIPVMQFFLADKQEIREELHKTTWQPDQAVRTRREDSNAKSDSRVKEEGRTKK